MLVSSTSCFPEQNEIPFDRLATDQGRRRPKKFPGSRSHRISRKIIAFEDDGNTEIVWPDAVFQIRTSFPSIASIRVVMISFQKIFPAALLWLAPRSSGCPCGCLGTQSELLQSPVRKTSAIDVVRLATAAAAAVAADAAVFEVDSVG